MIRRDALRFDLRHRIEPDEPYFRNLSDRWSAALRAAHNEIEAPRY